MNTGIHYFKELNQKFMNKKVKLSQEDAIKLFPDKTDRKRVKNYGYDDYYNMPDCPQFTQKVKNDGWIIALINFVALLLLAGTVMILAKL